jgi:hypothetical protein
LPCPVRRHELCVLLLTSGVDAIWVSALLPMADDLVRKHIAALIAEGDRDRAQVAERLEAWCWPGGSADRAEPAAAQWVSRWRPARAALAVPVCLCASGHCPVCN